MAHSAIPHSGQRYGTARKRGITGEMLKLLKMSATRRSSGASEDGQRAINEKIALENRKHQDGLR
ncbi:MAG: hypothetical protein QG579_162 [Patescibacteria group bacterium]|nr:hypothetical protein [Patescibacteria group bacterium]